MEILFFWVVFAVIVGVAANTRRRNGFGWFVLAILISPLLAGLMVLASPRRVAGTTQVQSADPPPWGGSRTTTRVQRDLAFTADGVYAGIPYRVMQDQVIEAMMPAGLVRFRSMEHFIAAASGEDA